MEIEEILKNEGVLDNLAHAYLLIGSKNKTEKALEILVKKLNADFADTIVIEPEHESGKSGEIKAEQTRDFLHQIYLTPQGPYRVGIIKSCEKLNISSANILLKTLEEPPSRTILLLASANSSVLPTIKSRCRTYNLGFDRPAHEGDFDREIIKGDLAQAFKKIDEVVKKAQVEDFLNNLEVYLEQAMCSAQDAELAQKLEYLEEIRKRIKGNANQRLALECLILKIRG